MIKGSRFPLLGLIVCLVASPASVRGETPATAQAERGLTAPIGPQGEPKRVRSLVIENPGVYENYLVDAQWAEVDAVRIRANNVVLRNCEVRNARKDGVEVYGSEILIENCRIHHLLSGTFKEQHDAHGITGRPTRLTVRNCEIGYMSGDCLQFDPGREPWTDVVIENCLLYTAPLPADAAGFKKGERPGENGLDTKQKVSNPRSRITVRNCIVHGFVQPGQIGNMAALNLKNHIEATVENCAFYNNEICLRMRGPSDELGGALVTVSDCRFDKTLTALRIENRIERAAIIRPTFGTEVTRKVHTVGGEAPGFKMTDEPTASRK